MPYWWRPSTRVMTGVTRTPASRFSDEATMYSESRPNMVPTVAPTESGAADPGSRPSGTSVGLLTGAGSRPSGTNAGTRTGPGPASGRAGPGTASRSPIIFDRPGTGTVGDSGPDPGHRPRKVPERDGRRPGRWHPAPRMLVGTVASAYLPQSSSPHR